MARKYDITKMIESTTISFKEFNLSTGSIQDAQVEVKDFDDQMSDDKVITLLRNKYNHSNAVMITGKQKTSAYYGMSKETFVAHASRTNNKDGRNLIKRTLNAYNIEYAYYDMMKGEIFHSNTFIDKIDETEIFTLKTLNFIRKNMENHNERIIKVNGFDKVSEMYGMSVSDFIKYGTVIESSDMNTDDDTNE